jgi:hypothetical protein
MVMSNGPNYQCTYLLASPIVAINQCHKCHEQRKHMIFLAAHFWCMHCTKKIKREKMGQSAPAEKFNFAPTFTDATQQKPV